MIGRDIDTARKLMAEKGLTGAELEFQASHRVFTGNRPSVTMIYDVMDPLTLGKIIALYEHRVFVEGVIWGINSFDQWGVELGKTLTKSMQLALSDPSQQQNLDASSRGLIKRIKSWNKQEQT